MDDLVERLLSGDTASLNGIDRLRMFLSDPVTFEFCVDDAEEVNEALLEAAAELSRLSALVAEWQKAAEPFIAIVTGGDILESEDDDDDFRPFPSEIARVDPLTVGDFRRLSQLKDTTNADHG